MKIYDIHMDSPLGVIAAPAGKPLEDVTAVANEVHNIVQDCAETQAKDLQGSPAGVLMVMIDSLMIAQRATMETLLDLIETHPKDARVYATGALPSAMVLYEALTYMNKVSRGAAQPFLDDLAGAPGDDRTARVLSYLHELIDGSDEELKAQIEEMETMLENLFNGDDEEAEEGNK